MMTERSNGDFVIKYIVPQKTRTANHIIAYLDRISVSERIAKDDVSALNLLNQFTIAQVSSFIDICNKNKCVNCLAELLDRKNKMLDGDIDVMDEFTLDD